VSTRYVRLMDLLRRPTGCAVEEACQTLDITPAGARGMIRDLRKLMPVRTVYERHGGRGKGRRAIHFVQPNQLSPESHQA
jgi:molybdenum-dependent DNA-binding transcriptional regulator ModE